MGVHPLVTQLRFARSEFTRCLGGVSAADATKRLLPMNCISWFVGHLANQEQAYWLFIAQDKIVVPSLNDLVGFGKPASTPPLSEMWIAWRNVTTAADVFLETLTIERLTEHMVFKGKPRPDSIGTMLQRNIYHYWFHTGEAHAVRQQLGHSNLPDFVGDMTNAIYKPE
jgi:uncharacterized damage-inducible protein DinB